ncbi:MAG: 1,2-dihydroxy-3-keto-5-methylthiopentene dioxygenase [Waterburya sp.]
MAILQLENGTTYTNLSDIMGELSCLDIQLKHLPLTNKQNLTALLARENLSDCEKEQVLQKLEVYFQQLRQAENYQSCDLIVLHSKIQHLDALLSKFEKSHIHADDEVRYIIAGEGVFGFVRPDGSQIELKVQPEDYINVPKGIEHWFYLTQLRQIKAVRYFINTEGWMPEYTGTKKRINSSFYSGC